MRTIHASALARWADCPRRAAIRSLDYVEQEAWGIRMTTPPQIGARVGTSVHSAIAVLLAGGDTGDAVAAIGDFLAERPDTELSRDLPSIDRAHAKAVECVAAWLTLPRIRPTVIETPITGYEVAGLTVVGTPDTIGTLDDVPVLADVKTSARGGGWYAPQFGAYLLGLPETPIQSVVVDWLIYGGKEPARATRTVLDPDGCRGAASAVLEQAGAAFARSVVSGKPVGLANPNSTLCSAKWCPAHGTAWCPESTLGKES
ncbi:MAG TPA: PD-(D/E)XK nuclease family protein [Acidiphilium sp.]